MIIVYCPRTHTHMQTRGVEVFAERMCRKNNTEDHNMFWRECVCVLYGTNESKSESVVREAPSPFRHWLATGAHRRIESN